MTARQFADAESTLRKAAALPNPPAEAYTLLGQLFIAQGRLADATKEFLELVEKDPRSVRAHVMLGLLLHAQREYAARSSTTKGPWSSILKRLPRPPTTSRGYMPSRARISIVR